MKRVVIKTVVYEKETRTRRVQLVFEPSVYDKLKALCDKDRMSVNERMHILVEAFIEMREEKGK